ncbi:MAG TPA: hypothetical protein VGF55_24430 [Gemmataceae bacterium]|jgi:hypothetical protein
MFTEAELLNAAEKQLEGLFRKPIRAKHVRRPNNGPDKILRAGKYLFVVEAKSSNRLASIHRACEQARAYAQKESPGAIPLVVVPFMGPSGREACDEAKVSFVDAAGNAHIEAPGLLVHVEGKPNRSPAPGRPSSVFAPRSSRVARQMLLDPQRWWRQKDLADKTRLGRGFISRIVARLAEDGLLDRSDDGEVRPSDPDLLLDAWKDEYEFRRHHIIAGHTPARSGEELAGRIADAADRYGHEYAFTGLPAAAALAPFAAFRLAAAYFREHPSDGFLESLGFHAGERGANTWLILPADDGVFDGAKEVRGRTCVSAVQAYLDLLHMPERANEAAEHLREVCLKWR